MSRTRLILLLNSICITLFIILPASGLTYKYPSQGVTIQTPRVFGIFGKKLTASGGVVITSKDAKVNAGSVVWLFDQSGRNITQIEATGNVKLTSTELNLTSANLTAHLTPAGNQIDRVEANGNVRFNGTQTDKQGSKMVLDGEGSLLNYSMTGDQVVITGSGGNRAHLHVIETAPPPAAGQVPVEPKEYDIRAEKINYNLKTRVFDAEGNVESQFPMPARSTKKATQK